MDDTDGALPLLTPVDADTVLVDLDFKGGFMSDGSNLGGGGRKVDDLLPA